MHKIWHETAWEDYLYWQTQDKKTLRKINSLLELLQSGVADKKTVSAILYVLASGITENMDPDYDQEQMSAAIRKECSLNKTMADKLSRILVSLYSGDHRKEWDGKKREGLKSFFREEFLFPWKGYAVWDNGGGTVDCNFEAQIKLKPTEKISEDKELVRQLQKNPFLPKESIYDLFAKRLQEYLDREFEDYCTDDDYYQPVVEDFGSELQYALPAWCKENGFEFISFEGSGSDAGYEPRKLLHRVIS